MSFNVI